MITCPSRLELESWEMAQSASAAVPHSVPQTPKGRWSAPHGDGVPVQAGVGELGDGAERVRRRAKLHLAHAPLCHMHTLTLRFQGKAPAPLSNGAERVRRRAKLHLAHAPLCHMRMLTLRFQGEAPAPMSKVRCAVAPPLTQH